MGEGLLVDPVVPVGKPGLAQISVAVDNLVVAKKFGSVVASAVFEGRHLVPFESLCFLLHLQQQL